jgi:hypothetical protein
MSLKKIFPLLSFLQFFHYLLFYFQFPLFFGLSSLSRHIFPIFIFISSPFSFFSSKSHRLNPSPPKGRGYFPIYTPLDFSQVSLRRLSSLSCNVFLHYICLLVCFSLLCMLLLLQPHIDPIATVPYCMPRT